MTQHHPVVERYLTHLETAIGGLEPADRLEVLQEIRNHIAEAMAAGKPLDAVIETLGPADALGRAYALELLLHPRSDRPRRGAGRWLTIVGLLIAFSIPTLVAVTTLGSIGLSFVVAGLVSFVVGVLEIIGVHLPFVQTDNLPPILAVLAGPVLVVLGLMALRALKFYAQFVVRTLRNVGPRASAAPVV